MHEEHKELPTNVFDTRLSEELDERLEFQAWTGSSSSSINSQGLYTQTFTIQTTWGQPC